MKNELEISKKFGELIMETRRAGHAMYFVQVKASDFIKTKKLIVEK